MRSILPALLVLILLPMIAVQVHGDDTGYTEGKGLIRDSASKLLLKGYIADSPTGRLRAAELNGRRIVLVSSTNGVIYALDGRNVVYSTSSCSGRIAMPVHFESSGREAIFALCWDPRERAVSAFIDLYGEGKRWFSRKEPSRDSPEDSESRFYWSGERRDFPAPVKPPHPLVVDLDGDGNQEVVWYMDGFLFHVEGPFADATMRLLDKPARSLASGDVDGDGKEEVLIATSKGILAWRPGERMRKVSSHVCGSLMIAADIVPGGGDELVCGEGSRLRVLSGDSVLLRISDSSGRPAIADLDGDGVSEIIYIGQGNDLIARGLDGTLWRVDVGVSPSNPAAADVDGDGRNEVVVASTDELLIISNEGEIQLRVDLRTQDGWFGGGDVLANLSFLSKTDPLIYDMDDDGLLEILVGVDVWKGPGHVLMVDEASLGEAPRITVFSPANGTEVGAVTELRLTVEDDDPRVVLSVEALQGDGWLIAWNGTVPTGEPIELTLNSSERFRITAKDLRHTSQVVINLDVDTKAPKLRVSPPNGSVLTPSTPVRVKIEAPVYERIHLSVYHRPGSGRPWVSVFEDRLVRPNVIIELNLSTLISASRGVRHFKFVAVDENSNVAELELWYRIGATSTENPTGLPEITLSLSAPSGPVSGTVTIGYRVEGGLAELLYVKDGREAAISNVTGTGTIEWDVSNLPDGEYRLILRLGDEKAERVIYVDNTPPEIELIAPEKVKLGEVIEFRVEGVGFVRLVWDLNGDGVFDTIGPSVARIEATAPGVVKVGVRAIDEAGNAAERYATVKVVREVKEAVVVRPPEVPEVPAPKPAGPLQAIMRYLPYLAALALAAIAAIAIIMLRERARRTSNIWG